MASFAHDVVRGLGSLLRSPGFTAATIVVLGLGVGANTLVFSIALVACWMPARRAARMDPVAALRAE